MNLATSLSLAGLGSGFELHILLVLGIGFGNKKLSVDFKMVRWLKIGRNELKLLIFEIDSR